ncbi:hypothetical protein VP01_1530g2 [Puccinia sorghi]|uniref:Uncharacterized protein n=1 Tax=Puccinia sorghi TaxID=27349 RepID=A0A0L6VIQ7_9BASI|nr:hypothetical protein VP01_1530g2 [Puccinia sorghi]
MVGVTTEAYWEFLHVNCRPTSSQIQHKKTKDKILWISWFKTRKDSNVLTGKKASSFWEKIHSLFHKMANKYIENHKNNQFFKPFSDCL